VDAIQDARSLDYWHHLDDVRRLVVVDLCFNLGLPRWKRFIKANAALNKKDYEEAAIEMEDSRWFRQTGRRAITMTTKHIQKDYRSFPSRKKHPDEPSPELSLYSAKGYVSWLAKHKKADRRKRN